MCARSQMRFDWGALSACDLFYGYSSTGLFGSIKSKSNENFAKKNKILRPNNIESHIPYPNQAKNHFDLGMFLTTLMTHQFH